VFLLSPQIRLLKGTCSARSFMRLKSGDVKFVAVDKPSSALEAEAETRSYTTYKQMLSFNNFLASEHDGISLSIFSNTGADFTLPHV
jgi:hypothetical protein